MADCIFCKIVKEEVPSYKIYEDKNILAFLDVKPLTKGHCLVIPKRHCQDIFGALDSDLEKILPLAKKISEKIKDVLRADGIRISQSNGLAAGQDVMHYHLHVIPRYKNDGLSSNPTLTTHSPIADQKELQEVLEKIKL